MRSTANMFPTGPDLRSDVRSATRRPRRWWLMPLLFVTTARFREDAAVDPRIVERLRLLERRGWTLRTAGARNYLAWRGARAMEPDRHILVLPNAKVPLAGDERSLAILRDIVVAELSRGAQGRWPGRDEVVRRLVAIAGAMRPEHALSPTQVERVLVRIDATLNAAAGG